MASKNRITNRKGFLNLEGGGGSGVYAWILKNKPELFAKYLPIIDTASLKKQEIWAFSKENNRRPSAVSKDLIEKKLGEGLNAYIKKNGGSYDSDFAIPYVEKYPVIDTASLRKQEILAFSKANNRRPSGSSKDPIEKKLGQGLSNYIEKNGGSYDSDFAIPYVEKYPIIDTVSLKKQEIWAFSKANNRRPSTVSKDPIEKKLGEGLSHYIGKTNNSYDSDFAIPYVEKYPVIDTASLRKQEILAFSKANNRRPSTVSKDPIEKKLGEGLSQYINKNGSSYDSDFAVPYVEKYPPWAKVI